MSITGAQLVAEGRALARPCAWLAPARGADQAVGAWGGDPEGPLQPILTLFGACSTFLERGEDLRLEVASGSARARRLVPGVASPKGSVALGARLERCLPPIDEVFRFGSEHVGRWLNDLGWRRDCRYNDNFPDRDAAEAYLREWEESHPLYSSECWAMVGGWPFPWPEDDVTRAPDEFVAMTIRDAEPWIELWCPRGAAPEAVERVT